jgi:hypothetical protein
VQCRRAPREGPRPWSETGSSWSARTDAAGRFALEGRWLAQATVEAETREVRLPLAATSTLRGRLVFPAAAHVMVPIDLRLRGARERVRPLHTTPSHGDSFSCPWLPDGVYVVSVPEDWQPRIARALGVPRVVVAPVEVTLAGGRDAEVELRIELP